MLVLHGQNLFAQRVYQSIAAYTASDKSPVHETAMMKEFNHSSSLSRHEMTERYREVIICIIAKNPQKCKSQDSWWSRVARPL